MQLGLEDFVYLPASPASVQGIAGTYMQLLAWQCGTCKWLPCATSTYASSTPPHIQFGSHGALNVPHAPHVSSIALLSWVIKPAWEHLSHEK